MNLNVRFSEKDQSFKTKFGEVFNISDGGFERGYAEGEQHGYEKGLSDGTESGYNTGYAEGQQAEYDRFWDGYQENGNRTTYGYVFAGYAWTDETFKPKYPIRPSGSASCNYVFYNSRIKTSEYLSKIDFSKSPCAVQTFAHSTIEELGVLDFGSVVQGWNGLNQTFYSCRYLRKIGLLIPPRDNTAKLDAFSSLPALTDVTFGGTLYTSISFAGTPINVVSMKSVIKWLNNYTGTAKEFTYKVTFSEECWTALEAETREDGLTWKEYVYSLGWNI